MNLDFGDHIAGVIRKKGSQECFNHIENGFTKLQNVFNTKSSWVGQNILELCSDFKRDNWLDVASVLVFIMNKVLVSIM